MSEKEKSKKEETQPKPKRKGRKPIEVERKLPLTNEEEETRPSNKLCPIINDVS